MIFLIPIMTYFKKKKFHLKERLIFQIFDMESQIKKKPLKIKKNTFSKIVLEIFSQFKNTWPIVNFKNYYTLIYVHCTHPSDSSTT